MADRSKEWELTDEETDAAVAALFIVGKPAPKIGQIYAAIATAAARKALEWARQQANEEASRTAGKNGQAVRIADCIYKELSDV